MEAEDTEHLPGPALDLGCGSGRHSLLLSERGWSPVFGTDVSERAVEASRRLVPDGAFAVADEAGTLPFPTAHFSVVVAWGVLHYNTPPVRERMMSEIRRVLAPKGIFLGTLRSTGESHIQENLDLKGAGVTLFDREGARRFLADSFGSVELGYSERAPLGSLDRRVCHWFFRCRNETVA